MEIDTSKEKLLIRFHYKHGKAKSVVDGRAVCISASVPCHRTSEDTFDGF